MSVTYVERTPPEGGSSQNMLAVSADSVRITPVPSKDGTKMIFSVWCQASAATTFRIAVGDAQGDISIGTSWDRPAVAMENVHEIIITVPSNNTVYFYKAQLEAGTKVTDWKAAPEDVETAIESAQDDANAAMDAASSAQESADSAARAIAQTRQVVQIETDGLYIYPGIKTQSGDVEVDTSGYHQRFTNMSQRIQRAGSLRPDFATSPTVLILGNQSMFRSVDGGTGWRLATTDDFSALGV